jgi:Arm DNA-binding domain
MLFLTVFLHQRGPINSVDSQPQVGVITGGNRSRQKVLPPKMLTNAVISASKPREKPFKMSDGGGLYLLVNPSGSRWWRFKFRVHGRERQGGI